MNIKDMPELLTTREVAGLFRVAVLTVKRWEKTQKLIPIRINHRGDRRYRSKDVLKILERVR